MREIIPLFASAKKARVEIIPLIDVVFFLLATFVLFTLSLHRIGAIPLPLPLSGWPERDDHTLYITASAPGTYLWREGKDALEEPVPAAQLSARLRNYRDRIEGARVFVSGDGQARLGAMVAVADEARLAHIAQVSFETAPARR